MNINGNRLITLFLLFVSTSILQISAATSDSCLAGESGSKGQTIYASDYSAARIGERGLSLGLVSTLFIRNTDTTRSITVLSVDSYDSGGKKHISYLKNSMNLNPLAIADFHIVQDSAPEGLASSVIIKWRSKDLATEPLVEIVIVGTRGGQGVAFVSTGKVIKNSVD
jgi:hypothetical protein